MWRHARRAQAPDKVTTVLGKGLRFRGEVTGDGSLRVDGTLEGDIRVTGAVSVGEGAVVRGNIQARDVTIAGEVQGSVEAEGRLEICPGGRLLGDLRARVLAIAEGGVFQGRSQILGEAEPSGGLGPASLPLEGSSG